MTVFRPVICVILRNEVTKNLLRIIKTMPERSFAFAQDDTKGNAKCRDLSRPPLLRGGWQIANFRQIDWGRWCALFSPQLRHIPHKCRGQGVYKDRYAEIATQATPARNDIIGTKYPCRDRRPRRSCTATAQVKTVDWEKETALHQKQGRAMTARGRLIIALLFTPLPLESMTPRR